MISKPAPQLGKALITTTERKDRIREHKCKICPLLKKDQRCSTRYVIYKMTCQACNNFYIGQTNRPFYHRYREHDYSLQHKTDASALSEHAMTEHQAIDMSINDFNIEFIEVCKNPVECKIREAKLIEKITPGLNGKHELRRW